MLTPFKYQTIEYCVGAGLIHKPHDHFLEFLDNEALDLS
mgnify:FL=1